MANATLWIIFCVGFLAVFALDMGVLNRKPRTPTLREAAIWSGVWLLLALAFAGGVFVEKGHLAGMQFLGGYVVELSLSADNVFLFAVIFRYFRTPPQVQHRALAWGILSAIVLRGVMIAAGAALITRFSWVEYVFGAFLVYTGIKMFLARDETPDVSQNKLLRLAKRRLPILDHYEGSQFFVTKDGRRLATLLLLVLLMIESTDLIFALDSIPAIFGITKDPFIVFTSNILAILGLRSLYFLLAGVMEKFHYLETGLAFVLAFVGAKMLAVMAGIHLGLGLSLGIILGILAFSIGLSLAFPKPSESLETTFSSEKQNEETRIS